MVRRNKVSARELLLALLLWLSGLLAAAALFGPDMLSQLFTANPSQAGVPIWQVFATTTEQFSPYLAAGLFIVALIVLGKEARSYRKKHPAKADSVRQAAVDSGGQQAHPSSRAANAHQRF